jgi:hypothetical protein
VYCGVYREWLISVLRQFDQRFSSFADGYRAQAERAQTGTTPGSEEERAILSDLLSLGENGARTEIREPATASD